MTSRAPAASSHRAFGSWSGSDRPATDPNNRGGLGEQGEGGGGAGAGWGLDLYVYYMYIYIYIYILFIFKHLLITLYTIM